MSDVIAGARPSDASAAATSGPGRGLGWLGHSAALLVVLIPLLFVFGEGVFTIDEQAYRLQAEVLDDGRWGLDYPTEGVIDQQLGAPFANSTRTPTSWHPYITHPGYAELVHHSRVVHTFYGPLLVSLLSVVIAALSIESISRWLGAVRPWAAFWFVGLASPIAVHGFILWAHAPAVALVAAGLALLLRQDLDGVVRRVLAFGAFVAAVQLRSDAPIAVLSIAAGFGFLALSDRPRIIDLLTAGSAAVTGVVVDSLWWAAVVDGEWLDATATEKSYLEDRLQAASDIMLATNSTSAGALRIVSISLLIAAVVWHRRTGGTDRVMVAMLSGAGAISGVIGSTDAGSYASALPAVPLLVVGWAGLQSGTAPTRRVRFLALVAVLCVIGPILTTRSGAGGTGWGGRYVLMAYVTAIPLALAGVATLWRSRPARPILVAALVATGSVQIAAIRKLDSSHEFSAIAMEQLEDRLPDVAREVDLLVTADPRVGRLAPTAAVELPLVSVTKDAELLALFDLAHEQGLGSVALVTLLTPADVEIPADWIEIERTPAEIDADRGLRVVVFESASTG